MSYGERSIAVAAPQLDLHDTRMGRISTASSTEVLAGLVERVTFHNEENGFCVLRVKARGQRDLSCGAHLFSQRSRSGFAAQGCERGRVASLRSRVDTMNAYAAAVGRRSPLARLQAAAMKSLEIRLATMPTNPRRPSKHSCGPP
jgi:hypothetical protein